MRIRLLLLLLCLMARPLTAGGQTGTLIVSFHTGPEGERLDRIRFRLTNEKRYQRMFPLGSQCARDGTGLERIVVVDDLVPGSYTLEFLVPNTDRLFEGTPKKTLAVKAGECVRIDQYFHPRYAAIKAVATTGVGTAPFVVRPTIVLEDSLHQVKARSSTGELSADKLMPGEYALIFEGLEGYKAPDKISLTVQPGENVAPISGIYECQIALPNADTYEPVNAFSPCMT